MLRDDATLLQIAGAARRILEFKSGFDEEQFRQDLRTQSAILHQFMILGEAVKRLSDAYRTAHPEVPWSTIARMRDHLIHQYDQVRLEIVWETTERDVPRLLAAITPLLPARDC